MATAIKGSLLVALMGVIVSGAVALAVSETKISVLSQDIESCQEKVDTHTVAINDINCTLAGMQADLRWLVVTLDDIREVLHEKAEVQ